MRVKSKGGAIVAGAAAVLLVGTGTAIAYWTTTGSGTGSAGVGTDTPLQVTQTSVISGLVPGGPASKIDFTITNPGAGPETVASVSISVASVTQAVSAVGPCTASDFAVTSPSSASVAGAIGAGATTGVFAGSVTGAQISMINSGSNQDGCKNATVNLAYATS